MSFEIRRRCGARRKRFRKSARPRRFQGSGRRGSWGDISRGDGDRSEEVAEDGRRAAVHSREQRSGLLLTLWFEKTLHTIDQFLRLKRLANQFVSFYRNGLI